MLLRNVVNAGDACLVQNPVNALGDYISRIRAAKGLSLPDVHRAGGPAMSTVSDIENKRLPRPPQPRTLKKLSVGLDVDFDHLMRLAGYTPSIRVYPYPDEESMLADTSMVGQFGRQAMIARDTGTPLPHGAMTLVDFVPVYGPVACGEPLSWTSDEVAWMHPVTAETKAKIDFMLIVSGNSLSGAGIFHGDRIGVRRLNGEQPNDGDIVAAQVQGAYYAKIYRKTAVGVYLESHEAGQRPEPLLFNDDVHLLGVVREHTRSMGG